MVRAGSPVVINFQLDAGFHEEAKASLKAARGVIDATVADTAACR